MINRNMLIHLSARKNNGLLVFLLFVIPSLHLLATESHQMILGDFSYSKDKIPKTWQPFTFGSIQSHTSYTLEKDGNVKVIKAQSNDSASGLISKFSFKPKDFPYLSWRWKVNKTIADSDVSLKSGDDYAARVYVIFHYELKDLSKKDQSKARLYKAFTGKSPPLATLNYIWANNTPLETIVSNPYSSRVKMVILKNKDSSLQKWYSEERNIYEDYKKAFGEEPKDVISIAIMTDTDNTGSIAESFYGDIAISRIPQSQSPGKNIGSLK